MGSPTERRVLLLLLPHIHLLDMAGPVQVLFEANGFGAGYDLHYVGVEPAVRTAQGLTLADLEPLPDVRPEDLILVPGIDSSTLDDLSHSPAAWLRGAGRTGAGLGSICTGAWVLAHAGLLNGKECTTHWKVVDRMQAAFPAARIHANRLFVRDGNVITSAGVTSGIDMALSIVEEDHGARLTARVARGMVVYTRRSGAERQESIFLEYRTHIHPGIHRAQDWLIAHPDSNPTLDELGRVAAMSPRNLSRVFRKTTGITLKEFTTKVKLEIARNLFHNPELTMEDVASRCGYRDPRQLRRLWKRSFGERPSDYRVREGRLP